MRTSCLGGEYKLAEYFTLFMKKTYVNYWLKTARTTRRQLDRQHHSTIWRIYSVLNNPLSPKVADKGAI